MHSYNSSACTITIALHAQSQYVCMQNHNISACLHENSIPACCWPHTYKSLVIMQICCYYADMLLSCISQKRNLQCMQEYCHHAQHYNLHFDHTISACMVMTYLYDDKFMHALQQHLCIITTCVAQKLCSIPKRLF